MQLNLGTKIRALRQRDGRTQDALAEALGVSAQAVSRWESGGSYPDMETIPTIANYFHISIDELFGYNNDREEKINDIINKAQRILSTHMGFVLYEGCLSDDVYECIEMLRTASEEFPNEPRILGLLAQELMMWGIHAHGIGIELNETTGMMEEDEQHNTQNVFWQEAIDAYEKTLKADLSTEDREEYLKQLIPLYCRMGQYDKAEALANAQNSIAVSRELMLAMATKGEEKARYRSEGIMALLTYLELSLQESIGLNTKISGTKHAKELQLSVIKLYETIFADGRCGLYHRDIGRLYFHLVNCEAVLGGTMEDIIAYFDKAFYHFKQYMRIYEKGEFEYTAPLVAKLLPLTKENLPPMGQDFWQRQIPLLLENVQEELRKIPKYAECFE